MVMKCPAITTHATNQHKFYEKEEAKLISRSDTFQDLLNLQIPLNS